MNNQKYVRVLFQRWKVQLGENCHQMIIIDKTLNETENIILKNYFSDTAKKKNYKFNIFKLLTIKGATISKISIL